jgi:CDP-glucose 4,6-dehydratase
MRMVKPQSWSGRRVLVTGHTGFKGSWLSLWLQAMGADVTGMALPPETSPNLFDVAGVANGMNSRIVDIRDARALDEAVGMARPEVVFHLAAQPLVRLSYQDPLQTFATNVMGTANLLDALRRHGGAKAVVIVTTDKCYENREWLWPYRESDALGGYDPYSSSKACAELVAASFRQSFFPEKTYPVHGTAIATARAGNVIGGGDRSADRLIPDIVRAFEEGRPVRLRNPSSIRPWQHVLDPLGGYLLLAASLLENGMRDAEAFNFGPRGTDTLAVREIVETAAKLWPGDVRWEADDGPHPHEANLLRLDSSKAHARLGWQPRLSVGEAVEWSVSWYAAAAQGADMRKLTLDQIARYGSQPGVA